jgi:hypothetical protein
MMSSTSFFSKFAVLLTAASSIKANRSSGRVSLNAPLFRLHPGVRTDVKMYASLIFSSLVSVHPEMVFLTNIGVMLKK